MLHSNGMKKKMRRDERREDNDNNNNNNENSTFHFLNSRQFNRHCSNCINERRRRRRQRIDASCNYATTRCRDNGESCGMDRKLQRIISRR